MECVRNGTPSSMLRSIPAPRIVLAVTYFFAPVDGGPVPADLSANTTEDNSKHRARAFRRQSIPEAFIADRVKMQSCISDPTILRLGHVNVGGSGLSGKRCTLCMESNS
ncbi:hypothetical protein FS842_005895 [Serendipita sp. 407]|nr:hypothetical protein FS842_005895 [Serendipita sp. 407]